MAMFIDDNFCNDLLLWDIETRLLLSHYWYVDGRQRLGYFSLPFCLTANT